MIRQQHLLLSNDEMMYARIQTSPLELYGFHVF
jgi:hypothetical protein